MEKEVKDVQEVKEIQQVETEKKETKKRGRKNMPFATMCASECVVIPEGIWKYASGEKIRRITLFDQLGKSPDSGPSRTMVTASSKYGFTNGGYQAEYLELTSDGYIAFNPDEQEDKKLQAKFNLVIRGNDFLMHCMKNIKGQSCR